MLPAILAFGLAPLMLFAPQDDPLTGVWEGRGQGKHPMIPPEGVAFTLVLEARGAGEVRAGLSMAEASAKPAEASFDAESGALEFRCDLMGILVDVELTLDGEAMRGKASGLGMSVELAGKRTSRALPAKQDTAPGRSADLTLLSPEDWRADLAFLAENLPMEHANAFHTLTREEWERRVRALDARLGQLTPAASAVALAQLVAGVGDAHTQLLLGGKPFDRVQPVRFAWFSDGLFVTAIDPAYADALAARVLRIGTMGVDEALRAVGTVFASENEHWRRVKAPPRLPQPALLGALGILTASESIPLVVAGRAGAEVSVTIAGATAAQALFAPDPTLVPTPRWLRHTDQNYWFEVLEPERAVYLAYNRCAEQPDRPMAVFISELSGALEGARAERLVIDLRHNGGGNSHVLARFVPELAAHPRLAAPGSLRVLIGPETFSSGMRNAWELRDGARARLFGEPTGGKPDSYGQISLFTLPRSGLSVQHSTKVFDDFAEDAAAIEPDVLVPLTSADYFAGVDPVLERALAD